MTPKQKKAFCVLDLCMDLILTGNVEPEFGQVEQLIDDYTFTPGGSGTIFASQYAKLGGDTVVFGAVGDDALGRMLLEMLAQTGLDMDHISRRDDLKTGLGVALSKPVDRAILTLVGALDAITPDHLADVHLESSSHWHVASYFLLTELRHFWPDWLARCRDAGMTVSLDTNWDPNNQWDDVRKLLPLVDVFMPNDQEALAIAAADTIDDAGRILAAQTELVVIKCGADGARAWRGDQSWSMPGHHIDATDIVDTTGAGDNFDAGFIYSYLNGKDIDECLDLACRCATASLKAPGGILGQYQP